MGRLMRLRCVNRQSELSELIEHTVMGDYFGDVLTWRDNSLRPVIPNPFLIDRTGDVNTLVHS